MPHAIVLELMNSGVTRFCQGWRPSSGVPPDWNAGVVKGNGVLSEGEKVAPCCGMPGHRRAVRRKIARQATHVVRHVTVGDL